MFAESLKTLHARYTAEQMLSTGVNAELALKSLRDGVTAIMGSGANIAVLDSSEGKLMVDSGFAVSKPEITRALSSLSASPVRHLLNTHWHFDHTDGNEWIHAEGASIIAHKQTRVRMEQSQAIPEFQAEFSPAPPEALPSILFQDDLNVRFGGESIHLRRYTPAHTDTDISVYFERADILHTGDTWFNGIYPFTDYNSGGTIDGMIAASEENLALAGPETLIVCGHGDIGSRNDLVEYHEMLVTVRSRVATLKASGATLEEVLANRPTASFDPTRADGFVPPELFVSLVYRGL